MLRKSIIVTDLKSLKGFIKKICSSFKIPACLTANKTFAVEPCMIVCLYSSEGLMWEVELCKETKKQLIRQKYWWNWTDEQNFPTEGICTCPLTNQKPERDAVWELLQLWWGFCSAFTEGSMLTRWNPWSHLRFT